MSIKQWVTNFGQSISTQRQDSSRDYESVNDLEPFRAELFSIDQLANHARAIAVNYQVVDGLPSDQLLSRLRSNEKVLIEAYDLIQSAYSHDRQVEPAAEWLLDNFYLIEQQIRSIRRLLHPNFNRELPHLSTGKMAGLPRVYAIALELISHSDGRIDQLTIDTFIDAYQSVEPLRLGELWALPLMLKLGIIENLRRVSVRISESRRDRDLAGEWFEKFETAFETRPSDVVIVLAEMAHSQVKLTGAFLSELTRDLQRHNPQYSMAVHWIENQLTDQGLTSEQLIRAEGQTQAADQVSIGNSIGSLRVLESTDWQDFVDRHSLIEKTLASDPSGVYSKMDFATRDRYRHAVEALSRRSHRSEYDVALKAVQFAETNAKADKTDRTSHVGFYLVDRGRKELEHALKMRLTPKVVIDKIRRRAPLTCYLSVIGIVSVFTGLAYFELLRSYHVREMLMWALMLPFALACLQFGVTIANWLVTQLVSPKPLPRMDFQEGIPTDFRTLVAVPTMLTSQSAIEDLLNSLEVRYLSNRDPALHFALVTDFADADTETLPEDEELIKTAQAGIERLNQQYSPDQISIFYLFHRQREWNEQQKVWMGRERKRGKLSDLNATLRGAQQRFAVTIGDLSILQNVRYVITLDTDTQLPHESAQKMVGTLAHCLNQPVFNQKSQRVTEGYTVLQPRVGVSLASAMRSRFSRLNTDDRGLDPYTRVVSDVYQDLFDEGSFIGKGIYDVDAFERFCTDFPDNTILSHDLIEGAYSRSGLISDVVLSEEFPARYLGDMARRHRWIRGDWQIAGWLFPWVRGRSSRFVKNPTSLISRWKILDNLRRSLTPIAILLLLLISWCAPPVIAAATVMMLVLFTVLPTLFSCITKLMRRPVDVSIGMHMSASFQELIQPLTAKLIEATTLPYEAIMNLDAISRTLFRTFWSRSHLLEWKTASDSDKSADGSLSDHYRQMAVSPVLALVSLLGLTLFHSGVLLIASPFIIGWLCAPALAWWLSQPLIRATPNLSTSQTQFLNKLSRKTWHYFEEFVNETDHWLPPDNVQLNPNLVVASRTSPTNIGMGLLSNLSAFDFGFCSAGYFLKRTEQTFSSLSRLERYRGHFLNWYETQTLNPLLPRYVSTVDNGNLLGNLRVLQQGLSELLNAPVLPERLMSGLQATLRVTLDVLNSTDQTPGKIELKRLLERQVEELELSPMTLSGTIKRLEKLHASSKQISTLVEEEGELKTWVSTYERNCHDHLTDLQLFDLGLSKLDFSKIEAYSNSLGANSDFSKIWSELKRHLHHADSDATLEELVEIPKVVLPLVGKLKEQSTTEISDQLEEINRRLQMTSEQTIRRKNAIEQLMDQCDDFSEMDFGLLYNSDRELFVIGYNVTDRRLDAGYYDLLASEARLVSYILVAEGKVPQSHWFALGRLLTSEGRLPALLSWSGSMFEYLMPLLIMPNYENTLLDRTYRAVTRRQIEYGRQRGVPWGISESGYNKIDLYKTYQYRAFGVPGLGLKRGLADDLVIAPYASALGLMIQPEEACRNLERLEKEDRLGHYGLYEAIDYTPARLPPGASSVPVRQFMAHHQGMTLLSLAYLLLDQPMQRRFLSNPVLRSAEQLLQERVPNAISPVYPHASEAEATLAPQTETAGSMRIIKNPNSSNIEVHLLSNGRYHVVVTSAGGGYSRWKDQAISRWREDATRDHYGMFCYLRDVETNEFWSNTYQPTTASTTGYEAIFTQSRAEFRRVDHQIETYTQISVSPEDDIELRRVTVTNRSEVQRTIELTSYCEVVLAAQAQDEAHPAFSNLFVQTELIPERQAIFCTRRPRSKEEHPSWMTHMVTVSGKTIGQASFETDRMKFVGRNQTLQSPKALMDQSQLSGSAGPVLDPIVAIRHTVVLQPNESAQFNVITGVAASRSEVESLTGKYSDPNLTDRVFDLAWTHSLITLQQIGATEEEAQIFGRLAGSIIYASSLRRAPASVLSVNRKGQSGLWGYGISGDLPIVLVRIRNHDQIPLVRQVIKAHLYWRLKGLAVDLVIWNEDDSVYRQSVQDEIVDLVATSSEASLMDRPGGIFVRRGEQMSEEDRALLQAVSRIVLLDESASLAGQADRRRRDEIKIPLLKQAELIPQAELPTVPQYDLVFFNGTGGFTQDGREYVMILQPGQTTPAPWVNVIANPQFGTVVSESGGAYTWSENSHEYRLTPWRNDPVSDSSGEAIYLRDEESGEFWSPTPLPARGQNSYVVRHGFGYSIFDYTQSGITTELCVYVSTDSPVKFYKLKIHNHSGRTRQISATAYWELVLGGTRKHSLMHVVTEVEATSGGILARNVYTPDFGDRVAFFNCSEPLRTFTGDRTEFIGRNGQLASPAAMKRVRLSGRSGAGFDPCVAFQAPFSLADGQEKVLTFTIGAARGSSEAKRMVQQFQSVDSAHHEIEKVWHYWSRTLGVIYLETPDASLNLLANGWLVYQTLACRMWARSGFYQSGGAFGFRDQLQDAMALVNTQPQVLRDQILLAASRQFVEGDVQHWWHPPVGKGVRTHFSDDYLWLPLAICRYVEATGDTGVLEEKIPFLTARLLREDEESNYDLPQVSHESGTLYEHGLRAINNGLRFGEHGLPLMGCGDWNDGMNLVGEHGRGESVWLGFFLFSILNLYADLARKRGETAVADGFLLEAGRLRGNLENNAWDGEWYRRAYFDDGTPLGSKENEECQIDAISQSWSVLSHAGTEERTKIAMQSLNRRLVKEEDRLILLLDPPFDQSDLNPGYIKGYVPGVRENGGQYTHSAIWTVMAVAEMGDTERAWELFSMINPITHGTSPSDVENYRAEPYVVAADVYGVEPHTGRGGWTWYTGSAGWMYRLITESLIGLTLRVNKLSFTPKLPAAWPECKVHYRYYETFYHITIKRAEENSTLESVTVDGKMITGNEIELMDDHVDHEVIITIGPQSKTRQDS